MSEEYPEPVASTPETQPAAQPKHGLRKESIWQVYFPTNIHEDKLVVPVASFPMIIYFWPALITFLACALLQGGPDAEGVTVQSVTLGWVATAMFAFNMMVIVTNLDQKKFVIAILIVVVAGLGLYISHIQGLGLWNALVAWLATLEVSYSTDAYYVLFTALCFFFLVGMIQPRVNYWRLEPNEFVHYIQPWGRDQSVPRLGSTVSREVPDVFELLLTFGGGTLVIRRDNQVVARIEHVPFLGRRMIAIERMLGVTLVRNVSDNA